MKTLQQKIVDALRDAENVAIVSSDKIYFRNLAAKVESAQCENCAHYVPEEDDEGCDMVMLEFQGPEFGCWLFEQKEK